MNASNKYFYVIFLPTHLLFIVLMKTILSEISFAQKVQKLYKCNRFLFSLVWIFSIALLNIFEETRNCKVLLFKWSSRKQPHTYSSKWTSSLFLSFQDANIVLKTHTATFLKIIIKKKFCHGVENALLCSLVVTWKFTTVRSWDIVQSQLTSTWNTWNG